MLEQLDHADNVHWQAEVSRHTCNIGGAGSWQSVSSPDSHVTCRIWVPVPQVLLHVPQELMFHVHVDVSSHEDKLTGLMPPQSWSTPEGQRTVRYLELSPQAAVHAPHS